MKTILLVLVFATSVSAQTVERSVDLRDLGWGNVALRAIVELDGDPEPTVTDRVALDLPRCW